MDDVREVQTAIAGHAVVVVDIRQNPWPTFPMVVVKGTLVGGTQDTEKLIEGGKLKKLLA